MLPYSNDHPSCVREPAVGISVASTVGLDLGTPPFSVPRRPRSVLGAAVPEAAIGENHDALTREDDVASSPRPLNRTIDEVSEASLVEG
jgi:hypothetical protein